jgi:hypothetical protein
MQAQRIRNFGMRMTEDEFRKIHSLSARLGVSTSDAVRCAVRRLDDGDVEFDGQVVRRRASEDADVEWNRRVGSVVRAVNELTEDLRDWTQRFKADAAEKAERESSDDHAETPKGEGHDED